MVDANTFTLIFNDDDIRKSDQKIRENMIPMWKNNGNRRNIYYMDLSDMIISYIGHQKKKTMLNN